MAKKDIPARLIFRFSTVPGSTPNLNDLESGEIAINSADGKLFFKAASGSEIFEFNKETSAPPAEISAINLENDGRLTITLSDASSYTTTGSIIGETGPAGPPGPSSSASDLKDAIESYRTPQTLTESGGSVAFDIDSGVNAELLLDGDYDLENPTNVAAGDSGSIVIEMGAGAGHTLTLQSNWKITGGSLASIQSLAAGKVGVLSYYAVSAAKVLVDISVES